ncbi:MAG: polyprenyl synthetase family protein, partial [Candidatus Hodarchaeota archaeon]
NATTSIAVPMILINGAIDLHDDIIDQSKRKGNLLTVYGKFGKDIALLTGDALLFKGFNLIYTAGAKIPDEKMVPILNTINNTFFELGDGEALEFQLRRRLNITPEEYFHVAKKKAANVKAHTRIGAILGGGTVREIDALSRFGTNLGILLIVQDDFFDMIEFSECRHRIRFEYAPLPLLYALQNPVNKDKIEKVLKGKIKKGEWENFISHIYNAEDVKLLQKTVQELARNTFSQLDKLSSNVAPLKLLISTILTTIKSIESIATNKP